MGEPSEVGEIAKEANTGAKKHGVRAARLRKIAVIQEQRQGWSYEAFHTSAGKKEYMVRKTQSERDGVQGPTGSSDEEERGGAQRTPRGSLEVAHSLAPPMKTPIHHDYVELKSQDLTVSKTRSRSPGLATTGPEPQLALVASSAPDLTQGATEATGP